VLLGGRGGVLGKEGKHPYPQTPPTGEGSLVNYTVAAFDVTGHKTATPSVIFWFHPEECMARK